MEIFSSLDLMFNMRIGFGKDIHKLVRGRKLVLGGVTIPYKKGLLAHSDGDVVIHSLVDALIGALNLGDIGKLFPDTDSKYKDYNSTIFLEEIKKIVENKGFFIEYCDIFISCEKPKLGKYVNSMKEIISLKLEIDISKISIKCGTNEKLGYIGKNKAIESYAVVLLKEKKDE